MSSKYNNLIEIKSSKIRADQLAKIKKSKDQIVKAREMLRVFADEITSFRSKHEMSAIKTGIEKIDNDDFEITYDEAIEIYCKNHNLDVDEIIDLLSTDQAYYKTYPELDKLAFPSTIPEANEQMQYLNVQINENESSQISDFTIARKVLTFSYLLNYMYDKTEETSYPDKTEIAIFIRSLVTSNDKDTKIKNTNYYSKVAALFGRPDKATEEDLSYVKGIFEELGLNIFVKQINAELLKRKINK